MATDFSGADYSASAIHNMCSSSKPSTAHLPYSFLQSELQALQNAYTWVTSSVTLKQQSLLFQLKFSNKCILFSKGLFTISPGLSANPPVSSSWQAKIKQRSFSLSIQCNLPIIFKDASTHQE